MLAQREPLSVGQKHMILLNARDCAVIYKIALMNAQKTGRGQQLLGRADGIAEAHTLLRQHDSQRLVQDLCITDVLQRELVQVLSVLKYDICAALQMAQHGADASSISASK